MRRIARDRESYLREQRCTRRRYAQRTHDSRGSAVARGRLPARADASLAAARRRTGGAGRWDRWFASGAIRSASAPGTRPASTRATPIGAPGPSAAVPASCPSRSVSLERVYSLVLASAGAEIRAGLLDAARCRRRTATRRSIVGAAARRRRLLQCTYDGATTGSLELFETGHSSATRRRDIVDFDSALEHPVGRPRWWVRAARE